MGEAIQQRVEFQVFPKDLQQGFAYMQQRAPHAWFMLSPDGDVMADLPTYGYEPHVAWDGQGRDDDAPRE